MNLNHVLVANYDDILFIIKLRKKSRRKNKEKAANKPIYQTSSLDIKSTTHIYIYMIASGSSKFDLKITEKKTLNNRHRDRRD